MDEFWRDAALVTRAYLEIRGLPVPERFKDISPEELAPIKERVAREMSQWSAQELRDWRKP